MRLIDCQVQNVRLHSEVSISFSPRITLIGGLNETGKSTLIEALHKALFLKATATGAPIEELRSKLHVGHPTIRISFQANGKIYNLRKCFTGSSGQISLHNETDGEKISGPSAEEYLASLLKIKESLGSRQAKTLLQHRWAHLWVKQGNAGIDILSKDKDFYEFESLVTQLSKSGELSIQQSAHDQSVIKRIEDAIDENFTSRGIKKGSELWQRQKEVNDAEIALEIQQKKLLEYEQLSDNLIKTNQQLLYLQDNQLPKIISQRKIAEKKLESAKKLEVKLNVALKEIEPIQMRFKSWKDSLQHYTKLIELINKKEKEKDILKKEYKDSKNKEMFLYSEFKNTQEVYENLKIKLEQEERRRELLVVLLEQYINKEEITRLNNDLDKIKEVLEKKKNLEKEMSSLTKISRKELMQLRELEQQARDFRTREEAMATNIELLKTDQPIYLDKNQIYEGENIRINEIVELKAGKNVLIRIIPGEGNIKKGKESEKQYYKQLLRFGFQSLELAEKDFETFTAIELKLLALDIHEENNIETKNNELKKCVIKNSELEERLITLNESFEDLISEIGIPKNKSQIESLNNTIKETFNQTSRLMKQAENDKERFKSNLDRLKKDIFKNESNIKVINTEIISSREALMLLKKEYGDLENINNQLAIIKRQLNELEDHIKAIKKELNTFQINCILKDISDLEAEVNDLNLRKIDLIAQQAASKARCEDISSNDPYEDIEKTKFKLEEIKSEYKTLKRLSNSHKLLKELFSNSQKISSNHYSKPLTNSIGNYLKPLISKGSVAQLNFDQTKGFSEIKMRRGKVFYPFNELSGGMREQLSAALRLSMAEVLKSGHDGCLPIVFDDAFTNSDPKRIDLIKQMLTKAADQGLQIILLTCDPKTYESFADENILLNTK